MNEKLVLAAIAGFIIGWIVQWLIDVFYYRPRMGAAPSSPGVGLLDAGAGNGTAHQAEIERLNQEIAQRDEEIRRLRKPTAIPKKPGEYDDLELIDGIGPVFEGKLYDAGITTFAVLARTPADRLREIISPQKWQKIEPEKWIAEAAERAKGA